MTPLEQLRCGQLTGSQRLTLACGLQQFPREIFDLADTLEILDLSNNALTQLPADLPRLHKLRILFCSDNQFTELPAVLGQCAQLSMVGFKANQIRSVPAQALPPALRWLILTDNQIEELPPEIGRCGELQKLMLAGNPFCQGRETLALAEAPIASIPWDRLELQQQLGAGASGVIHQAQWMNGEDLQAVAVKLFKGAVTSDGLPQCEMTATLRSGAHAHLIPVLGQVLDHPQGVHAMALSLIDPSWRNLAGPPSLDSCTRDIYAADTSFDMKAALGIALSVASAARHLHAQGLMHGDLYAHNITAQ